METYFTISVKGIRIPGEPKKLSARLRLPIIAKSAILGKSNGKFLPIYQKIDTTEKQIAVWTWTLVSLFIITLTR